MSIVRLTEPKKRKIGEKGVECIFIGYAPHSKAYKFMVVEPNDSIPVNKVIESKDALFDETRFVSIPRPKDRLVNDTNTSQEVSQDDTEIEEIRRSKRVRKEKSSKCDVERKQSNSYLNSRNNKRCY